MKKITMSDVDKYIDNEGFKYHFKVNDIDYNYNVFVPAEEYAELSNYYIYFGQTYPINETLWEYPADTLEEALKLINAHCRDFLFEKENGCWKRMESAPKDGTKILMKYDDGVVVGFWNKNVFQLDADSFGAFVPDFSLDCFGFELEPYPNSKVQPIFWTEIPIK